MASQYGRQSRIRTVFADTVAINLPQVITVPSGVMWRVEVAYVNMSTVAVTGAVRPSIFYNAPNNDFMWWYHGVNNWGPGLYLYMLGQRPGTYINNSVEPSEYFPLPDVGLLPGSTVTFQWASKTGDVQVEFAQISVTETVLGY